MINSVGALMGARSVYGNNNTSFRNAQKEQKQQLIREQYNDIFEHEQAHKSAAGELGGPIVIEKNSDGIPVEGHVDIAMPVLNKENPQETIEHADTVIKSAMAPSDPSEQDYKVAAEAKSIKSQAISEKSNQKPEQATGAGEKSDTNEVGKKLNLVA